MCTESGGRIRQSLGSEVRGLECCLAVPRPSSPDAAVCGVRGQRPERDQLRTHKTPSHSHSRSSKESHSSRTVWATTERNIVLIHICAPLGGEPEVSEKPRQVPVPLSQEGCMKGDGGVGGGGGQRDNEMFQARLRPLKNCSQTPRRSHSSPRSNPLPCSDKMFEWLL